MRRSPLSAAVLTVSLAIGALAGQAVATVPQATAALGNGGMAAKAPAIRAGAAAGPAKRPVFLVTGETVSAAGLAGVDVRPGVPEPGMGTASPLEMMSQGGTTQVMPVTAAPFVGRGLAAALFEPAVLAGAESAGRLPVRITYSAGRPKLPGVTITSLSDGTTTGYLTRAGARSFGAALARQYAADHPRADYGHDGILRGVRISLAGAPAPARRPGPRSRCTR